MAGCKVGIVSKKQQQQKKTEKLICADQLQIKGGKYQVTLYNTMLLHTCNMGAWTNQLSASQKINLEYKVCKTTYGIEHFTNQSRSHIYPKGIQWPLIEASNESYMD